MPWCASTSGHRAFTASWPTLSFLEAKLFLWCRPALRPPRPQSDGEVASAKHSEELLPQLAQSLPLHLSHQLLLRPVSTAPCLARPSIRPPSPAMAARPLAWAQMRLPSFCNLCPPDGRLCCPHGLDLHTWRPAPPRLDAAKYWFLWRCKATALVPDMACPLLGCPGKLNAAAIVPMLQALLGPTTVPSARVTFYVCSLSNVLWSTQAIY